MTKCIVLGEELKEIKPLKKIEFIKTLHVYSDFCVNDFAPLNVPSDYDTIELIARHYSAGVDLMYAYNKNRETGNLYIGRWNDGVV